MPARTYQLLAIAILTVCLEIGCELDSYNHRLPSNEAPEIPGQTGDTNIPQSIKAEPLQIFAKDSFYLQRVEPEEVLIGVLRAAPVREGPNTRDMPFKLIIGKEEFSVYISGFDEVVLRPYVGHEVEVVGKRIDQRKEGYGIEIWIATISMR